MAETASAISAARPALWSRADTRWLLAALLSFIPNLGPILSALPAILLSALAGGLFIWGGVAGVQWAADSAGTTIK